jgi:deoxyribodipyrimidine photo-lyase
MLIDYDVSNNWGNWQYMAGVGNDPRGETRVFNPIKQACEYDPRGEYVMAWVPELRGLDDPQVIFQAWKMDHEERRRRGLEGVDWVERPLKKIDFRVGSGRRGGGSRGAQSGGSSKHKARWAGEAARGRGRGPFIAPGGSRGRGRGDKGRGVAKHGTTDGARKRTVMAVEMDMHMGMRPGMVTPETPMLSEQQVKDAMT